jgi:hypothetical protein
LSALNLFLGNLYYILFVFQRVFYLLLYLHFYFYQTEITKLSITDACLCMTRGGENMQIMMLILNWWLIIMSIFTSKLSLLRVICMTSGWTSAWICCNLFSLLFGHFNCRPLHSICLAFMYFHNYVYYCRKFWVILSEMW